MAPSFSKIVAFISTLLILPTSVSSAPLADDGNLALTLHNSYPGTTVRAYITGKDASEQAFFFTSWGGWQKPCPWRQTGGNELVPSDKIALEVGAYGGENHFSIPTNMHSLRVYFTANKIDFSTTQDCKLVEPSFLDRGPNSMHSWAFMELNAQDGDVYVNPSSVDFAGIPASMRLESSDGSIQRVQGLQQDSLGPICNNLAARTNQDQLPWDRLCQRGSDGSIVRVVSPNHAAGLGVYGFENYFNSYVDRVWEQYRTAPVTISHKNIGQVQCQTVGQEIVCGGEHFAKPSTTDIWRCDSGPFAGAASSSNLRKTLIPILCAGIHRASLHDGTNQPNRNEPSWYQTTPSNRYALAVHKHSAGSKMYAFPYDDVPGNGRDVSGSISCKKPKLLKIGIGGPLPDQ